MPYIAVISKAANKSQQSQREAFGVRNMTLAGDTKESNREYSNCFKSKNMSLHLSVRPMDYWIGSKDLQVGKSIKFTGVSPAMLRASYVL